MVNFGYTLMTVQSRPKELVRPRAALARPIGSARSAGKG